MKLGDGYKAIKTAIDSAAIAVLSAAFHVPKFIAGFIKPILNFILDAWAKPIYDLFERAIVMAPVKKDVGKKVDDLKKAKTPQEVDNAIDNLP